MGYRRVDRIEAILGDLDGRARLQDVLDRLRDDESNPDIPYSSAYIAIQSENRRLVAEGEHPKFLTSSEGEKRGWVRLQDKSAFAPDTEAGELELRIREANEKIDQEIEQWLHNMTWQEFESSFLTHVLEALGFQDVEITQQTRDGGIDARVTYQRGIVKAKALVSAKKWAPRGQPVGVGEVQKLRGIGGDEDTAIIITTGRFSDRTLQEARPGQNQRAVYLIDGKRLAEVCKKQKIGVKSIELPELFVLDPESTAEGAEIQRKPNKRTDRACPNLS